MPVAEVPNLIPALPEVFLAVVGMGLLMAGVMPRQTDGRASFDANRTLTRFGMLGLLVAAALVLAVAGPQPDVTFGGLFIVDGFAVFFKVAVLIAACLCLVIAQPYLEAMRIARFEFTVLLVFATLGMLMMISANDFISLYLGVELQSLALYVIAAFHRDDVRSVEAGLKYFVLGALASGMLLYGISLIYGFAGTTSFEGLSALFSGLHGATPSAGVIVGLVFIIAGLAFKVSAVPFHMWTPDVYEGAPTPVTAFFSVTPKLAAFAMLVRVMIDPFGGLLPQWQQVISLIAIASMTLGAFAAIWQSNIKRLMAYSSIGHVGYGLVGVAVGTAEGIATVLVYMAIYAIMTLGSFCVILCMRRREQMVTDIADLAGLAKTNPTMALAFAVFLVSLAGIPPLAGFFAKFYIFMAAIDAGLYLLAIVAALTTAVAAFYYLRIVKVMYFDPPVDSFDRNFGGEIRLVMLGTALVITLFFLAPGPLLRAAAFAAHSVFPG